MRSVGHGGLSVRATMASRLFLRQWQVDSLGGAEHLIGCDGGIVREPKRLDGDTAGRVLNSAEALDWLRQRSVGKA